MAAAPVTAQSLQFKAIASGEVGYATNPRLRPDETRGGVSVKASIAPQLVYQTPLSATTLQGNYSREEYSSNLGSTDSGSVSLSRTDQLSQYLSSSLTGSYTSSNRDRIDDPTPAVDNPFDIGRRTKTLAGSFNLLWVAGARDQFSFGGQASHQSYTNSGAVIAGAIGSNYTQYGFNGSYTHTLDARTSIGGQINLSEVRSQIYPDSRSIQPAFTVTRQISAVWKLDGHVGLVFTKTRGIFAQSSTSLGLGLNLCGAYPLTNICFSLSRDRSPSGFSALRKTTSLSARLSRRLTERSRVRLVAEYVEDSSGGFSTVGTPLSRSSKLLIGSADYDRDLNQRISAGAGIKYRNRDFADSAAVHSYAATIHVRAKLGRI